MNNTYKGKFTEEDKALLEKLYGYTLWMVEDETTHTGKMVYANHITWNKDQRMCNHTPEMLFLSLMVESEF